MAASHQELKDDAHGVESLTLKGDLSSENERIFCIFLECRVLSQPLHRDLRQTMPYFDVLHVLGTQKRNDLILACILLFCCEPNVCVTRTEDTPAELQKLINYLLQRERIHPTTETEDGNHEEGMAYDFPALLCRFDQRHFC